MAVIKGCEPHMPISLVSISAADSTVTVASHDGCLRHYKFCPPDDAAEASKGLAAPLSEGGAMRSAPDHSMAASSSHKEPAAEYGSDVKSIEVDESQHQSESGLSSVSKEGQQLGADRAPADSLKAPRIAEQSAEACNGHLQRTDHDREEQSSQTSRIAEHSDSQQSNSLSTPPGGRSERGVNSTALGDLNVEAVSALTVIESQLLYSPDGGRPDHLLSGFQVSCQPEYTVEMPAKQAPLLEKALCCSCWVTSVAGCECCELLQSRLR